MINYLSGILVEKQPPAIVIEVAGIGYEVLVPLSTLWELPDLGQMLKMHIQFIVREDAHLLYGFKSVSDKQFFVQLIKVNGIGPKVALAILSALSVEQCYQAFLTQDTQTFIAIPGIGKKTAERLMVEMQDKLPKSTVPTSAPQRSRQEAMEALLSLGYTPKEAQKAIAGVKEGVDNSEMLIKYALKGLSLS